jgi:hypothetical protein
MEKPAPSLKTYGSFIAGAIFTIGRGFVVRTFLFFAYFFSVAIPDPNQYTLIVKQRSSSTPTALKLVA